MNAATISTTSNEATASHAIAARRVLDAQHAIILLLPLSAAGRCRFAHGDLGIRGRCHGLHVVRLWHLRRTQCRLKEEP